MAASEYIFELDKKVTSKDFELMFLACPEYATQNGKCRWHFGGLLFDLVHEIDITFLLVTSNTFLPT